MLPRITLYLSKISVLLFLFHSTAFAGDRNLPMQFYVIEDACGGGNGSDCGSKLLAQGIITKDSPFLLSAALKNKELPTVVDVYFDSPGGSLQAGMMMGDILRKAKAETFVKSQPYKECKNYSRTQKCVALTEKPICYSACAYAFLGGIVRRVDEGAFYGLHQFRGSTHDSGESLGQSVSAIIALYLDKMGVDRKLLDIASLTTADNLQIVSRTEAIQLRIDNTKPPSTKWEIGISNSSMSYVYILKPLPDGHFTSITFYKNEDGFHANISLIIDKNRTWRTANEIGQIFSWGEPTFFTFIVDGKEFGLGKAAAWQPLDKENGFVTSVKVPENVVTQLILAKTFEIQAIWPRANKDLDPSTELEVEGLNTGLRIISK